MSESARLEEAAKHIKSAKKKVKTGLTKWTVSTSDYDCAALEYENAAKIYQHLKRFDEAIKTWEQAAEYHQKAGNSFCRGRAYDSIATIHKDTKDTAAMAEYMEKAAECYLEDGKPDKYAESLLRSAKAISTTDPAKATAMIAKGMDALEENEFFHLMPDFGRQRVAINVKAGNLLEAALCIKKNLPHFVQLNQNHNVTRGVLEVVVLQLARDDVVMAEREYKQLSEQYPCVMQSDDGMMCLDLVQAYQQLDADMLADILSKQIITFMQPDIARLTRKMTIKGAKVKAPPAAAVATHAPATAQVRTSSPGGAATETAAETATAPQVATHVDEDDDDWT